MTESERKFLDLFKDSYTYPSDLAKELDMGIEMLFYVEECSFSKEDIRNVVTALRKVILELRK